MNRSKRHALLFFESTATLMSNMLRTLINESLHMYNTFFKRFDRRAGHLRSPKEIVENEDVKYLLYLIIELRATNRGCVPHSEVKARRW